MTLPQRKLTAEEYLEIERKAEHKSEFYDGQMFAMSGASEPHESIKTNVVTALAIQFKARPCRVYSSDLRVKVSPTGLYTYPDIVAVCGERRFEDGQLDTLLNPSAIIEVLSPSTEAYDRGRKFDHYRTVESIQDYVVIAQDRVSIEHFARQLGGSWVLRAYDRPDEMLELPELGIRVLLVEIYDGVAFPANPKLRAVTPTAGPSTPDPLAPDAPH
ncbi:MAG TPA: Uma2 family endonuclease [Candidatus Xenobia bacterium]|jgi:Uma2 family endonuclease